MARTPKANKPKVTMKILTATGVTAINDSVAATLTDFLTDGKSVVYASASLRFATIYNRIGKLLGDYDESSCTLGTLTTTHLDAGFSVKDFLNQYGDADVLIIDDMTKAMGYPFLMSDNIDLLKKAAEGKNIFVGIVQSRQKAMSENLVAFVKQYAKKADIEVEEIKRETPEDDPVEQEPAPASISETPPQDDENKEAGQ